MQKCPAHYPPAHCPCTCSACLMIHEAYYYFLPLLFFSTLGHDESILAFHSFFTFLELSFHPVDLGYPELNIESGILSFGLGLDFGFSRRPRANAPPTPECTVFLFRHHGRFTALMASGVGRQLLFILLQHLLVPNSLIPFLTLVLSA